MHLGHCSDFPKASLENRGLWSPFGISLPTVSIPNSSHKFQLRLNLSKRLTELFPALHKCFISPTTFSNQALIIRSQERLFTLNKLKA